jgi:hypothetical protein
VPRAIENRIVVARRAVAVTRTKAASASRPGSCQANDSWS